MSDVVVTRWCRSVGAYRWMALLLASVLMATGFVAFTRDVTDGDPVHASHGVRMP